MVDLELADWIDRILDFVLRDSDQPHQLARLVNQCVSSRNLQILFVKASARYKGILKDKVIALKGDESFKFTEYGKHLEELINRYFFS